jgi:hypothetical protein
VNCGGKCIDPLTDRAFCGAANACTGAEAGTQCGSGQVCSAGACAVSCQAGLVNCRGKCVDPMTDRAFCGASNACTGAEGGTQCLAGEVCAAGVCALSCQAGLVNCGGKCIDPLIDRTFCGASGACAGATAGRACSSLEACLSGTCQGGAAALSGLAFSAGTLSPVFAPGTMLYVLTLPSIATTFTLTPTAAAPGASITVNGASVASGSKSAPIAVNPAGATPVTVRVVSGPNAVEYGVVAVAGQAYTRTYLKGEVTTRGTGFGRSVALEGDTLAVGAVSEGAVYVFTRTNGTWRQQGVVRPPAFASSMDQFGFRVALSGDTLAVAARYEDSGAAGVNGDETDNSADNSGAVYVFTRSGGVWSRQAFIKASNPNVSDWFGQGLALSGDTLAVGASREASSATGINGNQADNSASGSGAVYVFTRTSGSWSQQAYVKASNAAAADGFGSAVALEGDTMAVGASGEDSGATGVDGNPADESASASGAVYVFARTAGAWSQQAYLKASNTGADDLFGAEVALSGDTLAVNAPSEASWASGVNGNQADNSVSNAGAVYVFVRSGTSWRQQAYLKSNAPAAGQRFGSSLRVDGDHLLIGCPTESSPATQSGAAYLFSRRDGEWSQLAYLRAPNADAMDYFGMGVAISGGTVVVGAYLEDSAATGIDGDMSDNSLDGAGAAYVWSPRP